jgi:hypothetical protein
MSDADRWREGAAMTKMTDADLDALETKAREAKASVIGAPEWEVMGHVQPLSEAVLALTAEVRRLRALTAPSPAGTVRLLYPDGTHRDVDPDERIPFKDDAGDVVERCPLAAFDWQSWRRRGYEFRVAADWDAADGNERCAWTKVRLETTEQEAARLRARVAELEGR